MKWNVKSFFALFRLFRIEDIGQINEFKGMLSNHRTELQKLCRNWFLVLFKINEISKHPYEFPFQMNYF